MAGIKKSFFIVLSLTGELSESIHHKETSANGFCSSQMTRNKSGIIF